MSIMYVEHSTNIECSQNVLTLLENLKTNKRDLKYTSWIILEQTKRLSKYRKYLSEINYLFLYIQLILN